MARAKNPKRDESKKIWLEKEGNISTKELSLLLSVSESHIRKWKSEDNWKEELARKKPGGQKGNKNAIGSGAPKRNKNAQTHGAYTTMYIEDLSSDFRNNIDNITLDSKANFKNELQLLLIKEEDLSNRIDKLKEFNEDMLFIDRVYETLVPSEKDVFETKTETLIKSSPFERIMRLEAELNKTHGRIIKLLDSIKSYSLDSQRLELEQEKYSLMKQKYIGEFEISPDTSNINEKKE